MPRPGPRACRRARLERENTTPHLPASPPRWAAIRAADPRLLLFRAVHRGHPPRTRASPRSSAAPFTSWESRTAVADARKRRGADARVGADPRRTSPRRAHRSHSFAISFMKRCCWPAWRSPRICHSAGRGIHDQSGAGADEGRIQLDHDLAGLGIVGAMTTRPASEVFDRGPLLQELRSSHRERVAGHGGHHLLHAPAGPDGTGTC